MSNPLCSFQNHEPCLGQGVYIDPKSVIIGNVLLGDDVSVWPMAVLRGDVNRIEIGRSSNIQDGSILHVTHDGPYTPGGRPLILGEHITVGHRAVLHACTVENFCLIGMGALILDDVHIEHHVMVGAGSLVTPGKKLESGYLYLGNPARPARKLSKKELEHLEYSAAHYVRLKNKYLSPSE